MLKIGAVIDGKYKVLNKIGQGGMSVVYLAMNERANKQWAIKEIRKDGVSNFEVVKQSLVVETDLLKRLNHPNLPSIIDVIDTEESFLIAMDYIEGNPLSQALKEYGAQKQEDVVKWAIQLCDVLGYLHTREPKIIYRDMKPANIMLKPNGSVMLIDFGTAREFKSHSIADTTCLGTQGYAAPEQFGGQGQTDERTDIYCLGATLYHLITGHNPCEPPYEMYPIRQWNPQLSSGLEAIILKCTQRNPEDRYQSCAELMYALEHYHELDIDFRKKQNRRWWSFLSVAALTLVCFIGMAAFKLAENNESRNSYDAYLLMASGEDLQTAAGFYADAVQLSPGNPLAYNSLLAFIMEDQLITPEENNWLRQIVTSNQGTAQTNLDVFRKSAPEEYDEFAYQLGVSYFFFYGENGDKAKALPYLETASASPYLDSQKVEIVKRLYSMARYYAGLANQGGKGDILAEYTYKNYWDDLTALSDGDVVAKTGKIYVALAMYKELAYQLVTHPSEFKNAGVSHQEMVQQLGKIEQSLKTIDAAGGRDSTQIEELKALLSKAGGRVEDAFSGVK
ncbi:MAG: serine/threonine protein kinase [Oscillospiraceae bacterium]